MSFLNCGQGRLSALAAATALVSGLASGSAALAGGFPVNLENCGRSLTFDAAPERAVTIGQGSTEILLSLGLGPKIVGTATWLAPLPPELAEEGATLPRLADNVPGFEAVLNTRPDFVAAQWINDIGPEQSRVGTFAQFADFDLATYVSPAECAKSEVSTGSGDGARDEDWSIALLEQEIAELAAIFGVPDRGTALIEENTARIEEATAEAGALRDRDVTVLYWFSSPEIDGEAYVAGQHGAPGWISGITGVRNVVTSAEEWPLVGWETIAGLDPDVIVLGTMDRRNLPGDDVAAKRAFLETDPVASQLRAVRNGHLVEMDAHSMNPTLRAVNGVETLAKALRGMDFGS